MKIALYIPCYVDQFYPQVGVATLDLLEKLGAEVDFPKDQTCCGQPLVNSGAVKEAKKVAEHFLKVFGDYEYIVCPSGSCTAMVTHHYESFFSGDSIYHQLKHRVFELSEFLVDILKVSPLNGTFPHRVGFHQSCHGLRELRLDQSSETMTNTVGKAKQLLSSLKGIELVELTRKDECCGFGGLFSIGEESVSISMGRDRIDDHQSNKASVITSVDMSCLMHLDGIIRRERRPIRVMHLAELLREAID
jgi:L-lactate dehydrogenase complex protein LldE